MDNRLPKDVLERIAAVKNKRARIVLDKIAASGSITTDELKEIGYNHPPRAARDVRELGFSLETRMITGSTGRRMASYAFGDKPLESSKRGRKQLPKKLRNTIIEEAGHRCRICGADNNLQVDHRIPYEVAGESSQSDAHPYQVLCGSCNKTKSWECEHCANLLVARNPASCRTCYWADQQSYSHVAMREQRRIDMVWMGGEVKKFDSLKAAASRRGASIADEIKRRIASSEQ